MYRDYLNFTLRISSIFPLFSLLYFYNTSNDALPFLTFCFPFRVLALFTCTLFSSVVIRPKNITPNYTTELPENSDWSYEISRSVSSRKSRTVCASFQAWCLSKQNLYFYMCKCLRKGSAIGWRITKCGQGYLEGTLVLIKCEWCPLAIYCLQPAGKLMKLYYCINRHISSATWSPFVWAYSLSFLSTYGQETRWWPWTGTRSGLCVKLLVFQLNWCSFGSKHNCFILLYLFKLTTCFSLCTWPSSGHKIHN